MAQKKAPVSTQEILADSYLPQSNNLGERLFYTNNDLGANAIPDLIGVQKESYERFLIDGIKELLEEISPITDFSGRKLSLEFTSHEMGEAKYCPDTCRTKNLTYEAPLKVHVQLVNKETGEIKEQDVFLGSIPLMTDKASFIVNGIERVVVNQIVRAPGAFFGMNPGTPYGAAKIIPKRGAWLELETDKKGVISIKVDRKRKIPATAFLRILGFETNEEILKEFQNHDFGEELDFINKTLDKDTSTNAEEAYQLIYKRIRPGDLATAENAKATIDSMFFDIKKYDMGKVARYKLNQRFEIDTPNEKEFHTLQKDDFLRIFHHLIQLNLGHEKSDDIDNLSNRRVRGVGELVQNKFRIGLLRSERIIKDRMTVMDAETVTPTQLVNSRPITAALREFFANSQLSQFMDQTNPLSELAHKRRVSAMGPGGLSRERASFDVRDVHQTHYGRICPVATPEGPNIGLVVHLALFGEVNEYGFINTPFRKIEKIVKNSEKDLLNKRAALDILDSKGKVIVPEGELITKELAKKVSSEIKDKEIEVRPFVTENIERFDAESESPLVIAQANSELDEHGNFSNTRVPVRKQGEATMSHVTHITHIEVSPKQILSLSTSLIPFVEHDDNHRALMGTNMQRQAVPLITPQRPLVGTGTESIAGRNSSHCLIAEQDGQVSYADANQIIVIYENGKKITYNLITYTRSNQGTCLHQRSLLKTGEKFKKGDVLADGSSIDQGELALGANLLTAYMAWEGYNFEDAVVISDRLVKDGVFDTVHIEEFSIDVRDTKLGMETVTRDIPNVSEAKLRNLDENGIIRMGASVKEGDILVGKITPKGETELTAEERLLRAIFGDKARDVKDTSLKIPGGAYGKVVDIQIFERKNGDELPTGVIRQIQVSVAQTRKISVGDKVAGRHGNKGVIAAIVPSEDMPYLPDGTPIDICLNPLGVPARLNIGQILENHLGLVAHKLQKPIATPALEGISSMAVQKLLEQNDLPHDGKIQLYNGKTGEPYAKKTTVGVSYILKLSHLVEDKIHARSIGPYSLVTQQPLGGKAQKGGQRFGEMEVWALEAYGASHCLQEMLTIKSDDMYGRAKAYESIIKNEKIKKPRTPESFNVLLKELQALGLNVELLDQAESIDEDPSEFYVQQNEDIDDEVAEEMESETKETSDELGISHENVDEQVATSISDSIDAMINTDIAASDSETEQEN